MVGTQQKLIAPEPSLWTTDKILGFSGLLSILSCTRYNGSVMRILSPNRQEQRVLRNLRDALIGARNLKAVMAESLPFLTQLVGADRGALCVTQPGTTRDYIWELAEVSPSWFAGYAGMEEHDLVRRAVLRRPNQVLCESEIAPLREFKKNAWVQRSRELGMSLTHVMSVLIAKEQGWHGGITLYREQRRSFSERQRSLLQHEVIHSLLQAIGRCRLFQEDVNPGRLLEWVFRHIRGMEVIVLVPPARELMRTQGATALLDRWFPLHEQRRGTLPSKLLEQFANVLRLSGKGPLPRDVWWEWGEHADLKVSFIPLPPEADQPERWAWVLEELPHRMALPWNWQEKLSEPERQVFECWRRARPHLALRKGLTPREFATAQLSVDGLEVDTIARELGCDPSTVRVYRHTIYTKLGVANVAMLLARAFRHR